MAGVNRHHLDFEILDTGNPKTLVFVDASEYMEEPERPLLEVTMPGYDKYSLVNVNAKHVNTFNSSTLKINMVLNQNCLVDLPDGVWHFNYKICPYQYVHVSKYYLRTALLKQKMAYLQDRIDLADCEVKEDSDLKSQILNVYVLLEGAKDVVNKNPKKAGQYYQLADKIVTKLLDKFCKNCK